MNNDNWNKMYDYARKYYEENGNLLIKNQYVIDNCKLGIWISHQRAYYKANKLSKEKIELLEKIGMVWDLFNLQWNEYYDLAEKYYIENGNLLIPEKYTTSDGARLGSWIGIQRKNYRDKTLLKDKINLLNKIGMVWSVYDSQWNEYYDLLVEYYNNTGNSLVPLRYKVNNKRLGYWVSNQRNKYKLNKLTEDKIDLLNKVNMIWDPSEKTWIETYLVAKQYYEEFKSLNIPNQFFYKSVSLGSWVITQRNNYYQNRLNESQIRMLNEIGMEWDSVRNKEYIWDKNYNTVLEFYKKYKHLYIPINYVTTDGVNIGTWLYDQGLKYKNNELSEYRKDKLNMLDKSWLESVNTKSSFPEQAVLFYVKKYFPLASKYKTDTISEIDIYIPKINVGIEYDGPTHIKNKKQDIIKSKACESQGIKLIRIRDCECPIINDESYKIILKNKSYEALEEGIIALLNYLKIYNPDVNIKRDYIEISDNYIKAIDLDWYLMYEKLKEYYKEFGNINVPISYITPDGFSLGHWISNIRQSVKNPSVNGIRLNSNKLKLLDEIGMDWAPIETQWKKTYILAEDYYNKHGNLLIPDKYVTKGKIRLERWIGTQRSKYKANKLSKGKIELLERIGMIWSVRDNNWMTMYEIAVDYYNEHGDLLIPNQYITKDKKHLGEWIQHQRQYYKNEKLSNKEISLLNKIEMVWSCREEKESNKKE